jgi:hypothetical protein
MLFTGCSCGVIVYLYVQEKRSKMYTSSSSVELVSAIRLKIWDLAPGRSCGSGSVRFPRGFMYGMMHRMYACVRTYGYVGAVHTRLVVERVNERDLCVYGQDIHVYVVKRALSRVNANVC